METSGGGGCCTPLYKHAQIWEHGGGGSTPVYKHAQIWEHGGHISSHLTWSKNKFYEPENVLLRGGGKLFLGPLSILS